MLKLNNHTNWDVGVLYVFTCSSERAVSQQSSRWPQQHIHCLGTSRVSHRFTRQHAARGLPAILIRYCTSIAAFPLREPVPNQRRSYNRRAVATPAGAPADNCGLQTTLWWRQQNQIVLFWRWVSFDLWTHANSWILFIKIHIFSVSLHISQSLSFWCQFKSFPHTISIKTTCESRRENEVVLQ